MFSLQLTFNFGSESLFWGTQKYYPTEEINREKEMWTTSLPINFSSDVIDLSWTYFFFDKWFQISLNRVKRHNSSVHIGKDKKYNGKFNKWQKYSLSCFICPSNMCLPSNAGHTTFKKKMINNFHSLSAPRFFSIQVFRWLKSLFSL